MPPSRCCFRRFKMFPNDEYYKYGSMLFGANVVVAICYIPLIVFEDLFSFKWVLFWLTVLCLFFDPILSWWSRQGYINDVDGRRRHLNFFLAVRLFVWLLYTLMFWYKMYMAQYGFRTVPMKLRHVRDLDVNDPDYMPDQLEMVMPLDITRWYAPLFVKTNKKNIFSFADAQQKDVELSINPEAGVISDVHGLRKAGFQLQVQLNSGWCAMVLGILVFHALVKTLVLLVLVVFFSDTDQHVDDEFRSKQEFAKAVYAKESRTELDMYRFHKMLPMHWKLLKFVARCMGTTRETADRMVLNMIGLIGVHNLSLGDLMAGGNIATNAKLGGLLLPVFKTFGRPLDREVDYDDMDFVLTYVAYAWIAYGSELGEMKQPKTPFKTLCMLYCCCCCRKKRERKKKRRRRDDDEDSRGVAAGSTEENDAGAASTDGEVGATSSAATKQPILPATEEEDDSDGDAPSTKKQDDFHFEQTVKGYVHLLKARQARLLSSHRGFKLHSREHLFVVQEAITRAGGLGYIQVHYHHACSKFRYELKCVPKARWVAAIYAVIRQIRHVGILRRSMAQNVQFPREHYRTPEQFPLAFIRGRPHVRVMPQRRIMGFRQEPPPLEVFSLTIFGFEPKEKASSTDEILEVQATPEQHDEQTETTDDRRQITSVTLTVSDYLRHLHMWQNGNEVWKKKADGSQLQADGVRKQSVRFKSHSGHYYVSTSGTAPSEWMRRVAGNANRPDFVPGIDTVKSSMPMLQEHLFNTDLHQYILQAQHPQKAPKDDSSQTMTNNSKSEITTIKEEADEATSEAKDESAAEVRSKMGIVRSSSPIRKGNSVFAAVKQFENPANKSPDRSRSPDLESTISKRIAAGIFSGMKSNTENFSKRLNQTQSRGSSMGAPNSAMGGSLGSQGSGDSFSFPTTGPVDNKNVDPSAAVEVTKNVNHSKRMSADGSTVEVAGLSIQLVPHFDLHVEMTHLKENRELGDTSFMSSLEVETNFRKARWDYQVDKCLIDGRIPHVLAVEHDHRYFKSKVGGLKSNPCDIYFSLFADGESFSQNPNLHEMAEDEVNCGTPVIRPPNQRKNAQRKNARKKHKYKAHGVYASESQALAEKDKDMSVELLKVSSDLVGGEKGCFFAVLDHLSGALVIGFRGTANLLDWFTNFSYQPVRITPDADEDETVHLAMFNCAHAALSELRSDIEALPDGYSLVCCGHSLGGGNATVMGLLLTREYPELHEQNRIRCLLVAPPACACSRRLAQESKDYMITLVNEWDGIPRAQTVMAVVFRNFVYECIKNAKFSKYEVELMTTDGFQMTDDQKRRLWDMLKFMNTCQYLPTSPYNTLCLRKLVYKDQEFREYFRRQALQDVAVAEKELLSQDAAVAGGKGGQYSGQYSSALVSKAERSKVGRDGVVIPRKPVKKLRQLTSTAHYFDSYVGPLGELRHIASAADWIDVFRAKMRIGDKLVVTDESILIQAEGDEIKMTFQKGAEAKVASLCGDHGVWVEFLGNNNFYIAIVDIVLHFEWDSFDVTLVGEDRWTPYPGDNVTYLGPQTALGRQYKAFDIAIGDYGMVIRVNAVSHTAFVNFENGIGAWVGFEEIKHAYVDADEAVFATAMGNSNKAEDVFATAIGTTHAERIAREMNEGGPPPARLGSLQVVDLFSQEEMESKFVVNAEVEMVDMQKRLSATEADSHGDGGQAQQQDSASGKRVMVGTFSAGGDEEVIMGEEDEAAPVEIILADARQGEPLLTVADPPQRMSLRQLRKSAHQKGRDQYLSRRNILKPEAKAARVSAICGDYGVLDSYLEASRDECVAGRILHLRKRDTEEVAAIKARMALNDFSDVIEGLGEMQPSDGPTSVSGAPLTGKGNFVKDPQDTLATHDPSIRKVCCCGPAGTGEKDCVQISTDTDATLHLLFSDENPLIGGQHPSKSSTFIGEGAARNSYGSERDSTASSLDHSHGLRTERLIAAIPEEESDDPQIDTFDGSSTARSRTASMGGQSQSKRAAFGKKSMSSSLYLNPSGAPVGAPVGAPAGEGRGSKRLAKCLSRQGSSFIDDVFTRLGSAPEKEAVPMQHVAGVPQIFASARKSDRSEERKKPFLATDSVQAEKERRDNSRAAGDDHSGFYGVWIETDELRFVCNNQTTQESHMQGAHAESLGAILKDFFDEG